MFQCSCCFCLLEQGIQGAQTGLTGKATGSRGPLTPLEVSMHGENTHARTSWGYQNWGFTPGVREEDFRSPTQPHGCLFTQAGTLKVPGKMLDSSDHRPIELSNPPLCGVLWTWTPATGHCPSQQARASHLKPHRLNKHPVSLHWSGM